MRYRYNGTTEKCLNKLHHLADLGTIKSIKGYRTDKEEYVLVKGTKGSARYNGFCWGGRQELRKLLILAGIPELLVNEVVQHAPRNFTKGIDWKLIKENNSWRCKFYTKYHQATFLPWKSNMPVLTTTEPN